MNRHKCDGCRYKGEHVEMGFKPFGVCYKETNLIKAEENYKAETCPYNQNIFITNAGLGIKTPYDDKIAETARMLSGEEKPAYLPQLYKIEGVDLAEPEPWPKENPYLKPLPEIKETDNIINLYGQASEIERQTWEAAEALATLAAAAKTLQPIIEEIAAALKPVIKAIADVLEQIINLYPNKRVIYLAKHGKERTRKKNVKRILKWFNEQAKAPSEKRRSRGYIKYIERDGHTYAVFAQN